MATIAMGFTEQLAVSAVSGALSAVVVTVLGGVGVWWLTRRSELRREDFEIRTSLVERAARTAQEMFMVCQHARRMQKLTPDNQPAQLDARERAMRALDEAYLRFSSESAALETVLGARFGESGGPSDPGTPATEQPHVYWQWHQIGDLLTVFYFNLAGYFPEDVLHHPDSTGGQVIKRNSCGFEGKFHSGVDFIAMMKTDDKHITKLRLMRQQIRKIYREVLPRLAERLMTQSIKSRY
jgi:hypothetical protein